MTCKTCGGLTWVCEYHADKQWSKEGCQCGAGMKCGCVMTADEIMALLYSKGIAAKVAEFDAGHQIGVVVWGEGKAFTRPVDTNAIETWAEAVGVTRSDRGD